MASLRLSPATLVPECSGAHGGQADTVHVQNSGRSWGATTAAEHSPSHREYLLVAYGRAEGRDPTPGRTPEHPRRAYLCSIEQPVRTQEERTRRRPRARTRRPSTRIVQLELQLSRRLPACLLTCLSPATTGLQSARQGASLGEARPRALYSPARHTRARRTPAGMGVAR